MGLELINEMKKNKGLTTEELSKLSGVPVGTLNKILNGTTKDPKLETLKALARVLGCTLDDFDDYRESSNISPFPFPKRAHNIPVLGSIPAGVPIEAAEDIIEWIDIPEEWMQGDREYFGLYVRGDSMFPEYLEGDIVVIRKQPCCDSGDDCVVMVNSTEATLKRVHTYPDYIELEAVNKMYGKRRFTNKEVKTLPVIILGVVVELRRKKK